MKIITKARAHADFSPMTNHDYYMKFSGDLNPVRVSQVNQCGRKFIKMPKASSHEENRKKVCAPCGNKIVFGKTKPEKFLMSDQVKHLIIKYINNTFSVSCEKYPLSICNTCRLTLGEYDRGIIKRPLPVMPNYEDIKLVKNTRLNDMTSKCCQCYICLTARYLSHPGFPKGRGRFRENVNTKIGPTNGMYGAVSNEKKIVRDTTNREKNANVMILCKECLAEIGRGKNHPCISGNRQSPLRRNVSKIIVSNLPDKQKSQIVSEVLRDKVTLEGAGTRNLSLTLNTGGKSKKISYRNSEKTVLFSPESLDNYHNYTGSSRIQMKTLTNFIRSNAGRKSIPVNYLTHVSEQSRILKDCYKAIEMELEVDNQTKSKRTVIYADAEVLLEHVLEERKVIGNYFVKIMADSGQGSFKISLSIIPEDYVSSLNENGEDFEKKRKLYSEGGTVSQTSSPTSVYKIIIICLVEDIKETYENLKALFDLIRIDNLHFKFVSDFKILLLINGQQTATASYPCPYCFIELKDLRNVENLETVNKKTLKLKTYGDLKKDYQAFNSDGQGHRKNAKYFHSTVNPPIFQEHDDMCVMEKCVIPELHILQGFVNHVFWEILCPVVGREKALLWPQKLNIIAKNYHGSIFEGNACRKLLKQADALLDEDIYAEVGLFRLIPFVSVFKAMDTVVHNCFSLRAASLQLIESQILHLRRCYVALEATIPLKIHVLLDHTIEGLKLISNNGLGLWSEQAGESIHREFLGVWERYKVNSKTNKIYVDRLLNAVVEFSSRHL